jgi:phage repressor protein C with HTH and peptisase S24 domain
MGKNENNETGTRLRQIADRLYEGNKSELARSLDMKPPSFSKYVQGHRRPGTTVLKRLSRLGVNLHWFLTGEGSMMRTVPDRSQPVSLVQAMGPSEIQGPNGPLHRVPLTRIVVNDTNDLQLQEMEAAEWLSESFIREVYGVAPGHLKNFRVSGNAMQDLIEPGERVRGVLWDGESLSDGAIYFLHGPAGVIVRRVHLQGETIHLSAANPEVPAQKVPKQKWREHFRPLARIVEVLRSV